MSTWSRDTMCPNTCPTEMIIIDVIDENHNHTDDTLSWELDAGWSGGKRRPLTAAQIETDDATTSDGNMINDGITM